MIARQLLWLADMREARGAQPLPKTLALRLRLNKKHKI